MGGHLEASGTPSNTIALWPPFSVANTGLQNRVHQTIAG